MGLREQVLPGTGGWGAWRPRKVSWELGGSSRLQGPGPHGSEDEGKGLGSRLDIQQGHPLVLVATLPAMYHLGVSHVREQLLLGLVQLLSRVIAVHREQVMAKPVYPLFLLDIHYHSHHHPDQGDEEERPQHIAHHGVAVGLGGIGHCGVTHDIGSWRAG